MITTKSLCRLVKAAMAVDVPAAMSELNAQGGWVYVKDYEKYGRQVSALHKSILQLKKEGAKPSKKRRKR